MISPEVFLGISSGTPAGIIPQILAGVPAGLFPGKRDVPSTFYRDYSNNSLMNYFAYFFRNFSNDFPSDSYWIFTKDSLRSSSSISHIHFCLESLKNFCLRFSKNSHGTSFRIVSGHAYKNLFTYFPYFFPVISSAIPPNAVIEILLRLCGSSVGFFPVIPQVVSPDFFHGVLRKFHQEFPQRFILGFLEVFLRFIPQRFLCLLLY